MASLSRRVDGQDRGREEKAGKMLAITQAHNSAATAATVRWSKVLHIIHIVFHMVM